MAPRSAHIDHLASVPLFSGCSKKELGRIAKASDTVQVAGGSTLVDQGDTGRECYVVTKGTATVRRSRRKIGTLGPGDCLGELSLLDHGPRTASVVADNDMELLVITARDFAAILDDVPSIARKVLASLAGRVRDLDRKVYG